MHSVSARTAPASVQSSSSSHLTPTPPSTAGADVRRPANVKSGSKNSSPPTSPFNHAAVDAYDS
jgi:hypothetical protein